MIRRCDDNDNHDNDINDDAMTWRMEALVTAYYVNVVLHVSQSSILTKYNNFLPELNFIFELYYTVHLFEKIFNINIFNKLIFCSK